MSSFGHSFLYQRKDPNMCYKEKKEKMRDIIERDKRCKSDVNESGCVKIR